MKDNNNFILPLSISLLNKNNTDIDDIDHQYNPSMLEKLKYFSARLIIDEENKLLYLKGIDFNLLFKRISDYYKENSIQYMLVREYNSKSIKKYKNKKIKKSAMKVQALKVPLFFSLELAILFKELGEVYKIPYYIKVYNIIKEKTWINKLFQPIDVINTNTSNLANIKFTLKDYQLDFVKSYNTLKNRFDLEGYLLSFDQGLGKTLTAIALSECLNKQQVVIVCPNSLKENWSYEIKSYYEKYNDEELWKQEVYVVGNNNYIYDKNKTKYIIVNMESISKIYPYIQANKNSIIIVDEMHNFRNLSGKRTSELIKLKEYLNCKDNLLMSGTPIKAIPTEMIPTMMMIDPMFTIDVAKIYNKAFNINTASAKNIINSRFGMFMHRKTKDEVLSLPKKIKLPLSLNLVNGDRYLISNIKRETSHLFMSYYAEELEKNKEYREQYIGYINKYSSAKQSDTKRYISYLVKNINTGKNYAYHELDLEFFNSFPEKYIIPNIHSPFDVKEFNELYSKFVKMKNSCMGRALGKILPKAREEMYISLYDENKELIIKMINDNPRKTIIFSTIRNVITHISKDLSEMGINNVSIIGGTKNRMDLIQYFKQSDDCRVLLATSQTLSTGVTLTEANQMLFFATPWRSADYEQACDRIYRIGQTTDVTIYNVLLNTPEKNLSTRMNEILEWSEDMFGELIEQEDLNECSNMYKNLNIEYNTNIINENYNINI